MTVPEWQDWPEEPWVPTPESDPNHGTDTYLAADAYIYPLDPFEKDKPAAAGYHRALAAVNALAGRRNPAAVGEVIEAARTACDVLEQLSDETSELGFGTCDPADLRAALAKLDREPD